MFAGACAVCMAGIVAAACVLAVVGTPFWFVIAAPFALSAAILAVAASAFVGSERWRRMLIAIGVAIPSVWVLIILFAIIPSRLD